MFPFRALRDAVLACFLVASMVVGVVSVNAEPGLSRNDLLIVAVDVDAGFEALLSDVVVDVREELRLAGIGYESLRIDGSTVTLSVPEQDQLGAALAPVSKRWPGLSVTSSGPLVTMSFSNEVQERFDADLVAQTITFIRYGLLDEPLRPWVRKVGRSCVEFPHPRPSEERKSHSMSFIEFRIATLMPTDKTGADLVMPAIPSREIDKVEFGVREHRFDVSKRAVVDGSQIITISTTAVDGRQTVVAKGGLLWQHRLEGLAEYEAANLGIVLNDYLLAVRSTGELIANGLVVDGLETTQQAESLAHLLVRAIPSLPLDLVDSCAAD